jgi:hypothetical protein
MAVSHLYFFSSSSFWKRIDRQIEVLKAVATMRRGPKDPQKQFSFRILLLVNILQCLLVAEQVSSFITVDTTTTSGISQRRTLIVLSAAVKQIDEEEDSLKSDIISSNSSTDGTYVKLEKKNAGLKRLAELSLQDYQWRSNLWKSKEADRQVEQSLARMMGEENASYIRPMDASETSIGPLGLWEKTSVEWLAQVLEEEARRAEQIVRLGGILVRPMDQLDENTQQLGPLGRLEHRFVNFLDSIRQSEKERSRNSILRPKDMEATKRGPLGEAELKASEAIREFFQSEKIRAQLQSKVKDGVVRPIDVPGPLGDFEMAVLQVVRAEEQRKLQYEQRMKQESDPTAKYRPIRPMNANNPGPLGELEQQATEFVQKLTQEERQRLQNIQKYLDDNRPMQQTQRTALGMLETIVVGIFRAPILLYQIVVRVQTLLESEPLDDFDAEILRQKSQLQQQDEKNKRR